MDCDGVFGGWELFGPRMSLPLAEAPSLQSLPTPLYEEQDKRINC